MKYQKNNPSSIQDLFSSIASRYDTTNAIMSLGMHKYWNNYLVKETFLKAHPGTFLDLCCGTGEIAFTYLRKHKSNNQIYLIDFCEAMLDQAKKRAHKYGYSQLTFCQGDAQAIPLKNSSTTAITIAYGIRNVENTEQCLSEVYRVLDSKGICGVLELTRPKSKILKSLHKLYLNLAIPTLGKLATSNRDAYQYLRDSIQSFSEPEHLAEKFKKTGFKKVNIISLSLGAAHIILGEK